MKNLLGVMAALAMISCAPTYATNNDPAPVSTPSATGSMTPVSRSADGMIAAHANLSGWGPAPAALPPGAQAIVLDGDPAKAELFTLRLKVPHNYLVRPHFHSSWEHVTVISGLLHIGMGETVSMASATELRPGSYMAIPTGHKHFAHAVGETVLQIHGMGPFVITYVNRADDPRNR